MEEQFMAEGWEADQLPIMSSDFVLAGPSADPAELGKATNLLTVTEAFRQIALSRVPFVTRGDHSGTHLREVGMGKMRRHTRRRLVPLLPWGGGKPGRA